MSKESYFRGKLTGEQIIRYTRRHWIAVIPDVIPFFFFLALFVFYFTSISAFNLNKAIVDTLTMIVFTTTVYVMHRFFVHMINHFMCKIIITNYRIIEINKTLFARESKESMDMHRIQDIQFTQSGILKTLLKFGEIHIKFTGADSRTLTLIPNPDYFFRLINDLKNDLRKPPVDNSRSHKQLYSTVDYSLTQESESVPETSNTFQKR